MAEKSVSKSSSNKQPAPTGLPPEPWKIKAFVLGGVVGAVAGLFSAYLLVKNAERNQTVPQVSAREGFQIAVLLFGAIRSIANLWE